METPKPHAAGSAFDPALRMHYLRAVAQLLSTDVPVAGLWSRLAAPIAALLDAERVMVVVRDAAGERIAFDSRSGDRPADDAVPADGIAAGVLVSGETVARS